MKTWNQKGRTGREGVALLYAVMSSFVAAGMVVLMLGIAMAGDKSADTETAERQADFLADGALEAAKKTVQNSIANWATVPTQGSITVDGRTADYWVRPTGFSQTVADEAGIQQLQTGYEIRAEAREGRSRSQSFRIINSLATPIFQFAVFYTDDLEVLPGPGMNITGRVHTNGDMYLGSNATLRLNTNYVHAIGGIYRNRKDNPSLSQGNVIVREYVQNPWSALEPTSYYTMWSQSQLTGLGIPSYSGFDSNFVTGWDAGMDGSYLDAGDLLPFGPGALEYWDEPSGYAGGSGETVQTGEHDLGEAVVPHIGSIKAFEENEAGDFVFNSSTGVYDSVPPGTGTHSKGYYHENADLSVIVAPNGLGWNAYDGSGTEITSSVSGAISLGTIYDARQANGVSGVTKVVNINVQALVATGHYPANGLMYSSHYGAGTGTNAKGIKLTNASVLPSKLTVASEDPVYIQGDYNIGNATYPKVGAAVICDALNLLSNSWNGSKTHTSGLPNASNTTYNVAMIAGNRDSAVGNYNGGLENLPRFHENWTGRNCTIRGALINTWNSDHGTAPWVYGGNRYQAPNRIWAYDTAFNNVANLPPFTPMAVSARDIVTW